MRSLCASFALVTALALACTAGAQSDPKDTRMSALKPWPRQQYQGRGNNPFVLFLVYGRFKQPLQISRSRYRSEGVPAGIELRQLARPRDAAWLDRFLSRPFEKLLAQQAPDLVAAIRGAPEGMLLEGEVADSASLDYLRDTVGVVTALLDSGGVAVFDMQAFRWFSPSAWRKNIFDPDGPVPRHHVSILISDEPSRGKEWIHTRGMRKFGRPDISVHDVAANHRDAIIDLCNRLIEMMAFGALIPEGQPIKMSSLPPSMTCHQRGNLDDPDFNNVHVEITPPA